MWVLIRSEGTAARRKVLAYVRSLGLLPVYVSVGGIPIGPTEAQTDFLQRLLTDSPAGNGLGIWKNEASGFTITAAHLAIPSRKRVFVCLLGIDH